VLLGAVKRAAAHPAACCGVFVKNKIHCLVIIRDLGYDIADDQLRK
jgi:hypothetical protein